MPIRRCLLVSAACSLFLPMASAGPTDLVQTESREVRIASAFVEQYVDAIGVLLPDHESYFGANCEIQEGTLTCQGYYCLSNGNHGDEPYTFGDPHSGEGFGFDLAPNSEGDYGPYKGVFVNVEGQCQGLA